jgi:hypothetical protein
MADARSRDRNASRTLGLLIREGLLEQLGDEVRPTDTGTRLVRQVRRGADARPADQLAGRRIVVVRDAPGLDLSAVERTMRDRGADVMRSEGSFTRLAIMSDDYGIAAKLLSEIRGLGADAEMARVLDEVPRSSAPGEGRE